MCCRHRHLHLHANNAPLIKRGHNYIFSPGSKNPLTFPDCLPAHQLPKKCGSICFQATATQPIFGSIFLFSQGGWSGGVFVCMSVKVSGVRRVCKLGHEKAIVTMAAPLATPTLPLIQSGACVVKQRRWRELCFCPSKTRLPVVVLFLGVGGPPR